MPRQASFLTLGLLLCLALPAPASEPAPAAPGPFGDGRPLFGEILLESQNDRLVALGLDRNLEERPLDGTVDILALFEANEPLSDPISFQGPARVELHPHKLVVTSPQGGRSWEFSARPQPAATSTLVSAISARGRLHRVSGGALLYFARDFGAGLAQLPSLVREVAGPLSHHTAPSHTPGPFHDDTGDGGEGGSGCAESCSISCAGGGGSCSATCPAGSCATCQCSGSGTAGSNLASCSCG